MLNTLLFLSPRRRAEEERVERFLAAIRATSPAPVRPLPERVGPAPSRRTDTAQLPRIVLAVAAASVLTGCAGGTTLAAAPASLTPQAVELQLPVEPPVQLGAPASTPGGEFTGTDAGLITTPAPTVQELEEQDRAAAAVTTPAPAPVPPAGVVPAAEPAPVDVPAVEPAPVTCAPGEELQGDLGCVAVQLPEEQLGGARCGDTDQVIARLEDGSLGCGAA